MPSGYRLPQRRSTVSDIYPFHILASNKAKLQTNINHIDHHAEQTAPAHAVSAPQKYSSNAQHRQPVPTPFPDIHTTHQTNKAIPPPEIDIWSAGVILLTMLSRRFPFFNSTDDIEATIEIATIFGKRRMREAAALHGAVLHCTIPTIGDRGFSLDKIVLWSTGRTKRGPNGEDTPLRPDEVEAVDFLAGLLELDPRQRYSAEDALLHPFLADERELWEEYESEKIGRMRGDRWDTGWRRWWAAKWELEEERGVMEKEREWLEREDENEGELKTTGEEQVDRPMDGAAGVEDEVDML